MSYWVYLECPCCKKTVGVDNHEEGGTYAIGGTSDAELNVTYNYSKLFSVNDIHGKTGEETIPILQKAVDKFGTERDHDYWKPTKGNVGYMCAVLLKWAKQHPKAIWDVS